MENYVVIFNFVEQMNEQVILQAESEEEAVNTAYHAAYKSCSWPKERVTVKGVWILGDNPAGNADRMKQKKIEKKYSVAYDQIEKNISRIESRMGTIIDHCVLNRLTMNKDMERIKRKIDKLGIVMGRA